MEALEIVVLKRQMPVIQINFDDIKAALEKNLKKYENLVVTEQTLNDCKYTQKELASLRKQIDDYRKDIKREVKKPIDEFEEKCKTLFNMVVEVEQPIKDGINIFEEKRRTEKLEEINALKESLISDYELQEKYSDQIILEDRFLNITTKIIDITINLTNQVKNLKQQQDHEQELRKTISGHIKTMNETYCLKQPLTENEFSVFLNSKNLDISLVLTEITKRAKNRFESEKKAAESAIEKEQEKLTEKATEIKTEKFNLFDEVIKILPDGSTVVLDDTQLSVYPSKSINIEEVKIKISEMISNRNLTKAIETIKIFLKEIKKPEAETSEGMEKEVASLQEADEIPEKAFNDLKSDSTLPTKEFTLKIQCSQIAFNNLTIYLHQREIEYDFIIPNSSNRQRCKKQRRKKMKS